MKIILDQRKNARHNAAHYYDEAKKLRLKAQGAAAAIYLTKREMENLEKGPITAPFTARPGHLAGNNFAAVAARKKSWFDKFIHFYASEGSLVVGGRNAKQNDMLFSKHIQPEDYFLHADIRGSPAVVLKNPSASQQELLEAAQFTACYSSAWKRGFGSVDVYAVKASNVSKHFHGGYLDQGAFAISGERRWFRNAGLELFICYDEQRGIYVLPGAAPKPKVFVRITPGRELKTKASKLIKSRLAKILYSEGKPIKVDDDDIARLLPGECSIE